MLDSKITSGVSLIGIHGKASAGKDTAKDFIIDNFKNYYTLSFADPLKEAASAAFGIPLESFYDTEEKESSLTPWGISPRVIAQFLGTEMFRDTVVKLIPNISNNFWLHRAAMRLNNIYTPENEGDFSEGDTVVIPDVRFQNEYDWIIANGGIIIHLTRPGADGIVGIANHPSEQFINLSNQERTYLCENNGTLSELHRKIANIIVSLKY